MMHCICVADCDAPDRQPAAEAVVVPLWFHQYVADRPSLFRNCPHCGGAGLVWGSCRACGGSGSLNGQRCYACGGSGMAQVACQACGGTGQVV